MPGHSTRAPSDSALRPKIEVATTCIDIGFAIAWDGRSALKAREDCDPHSNSAPSARQTVSSPSELIMRGPCFPSLMSHVLTIGPTSLQLDLLSSSLFPLILPVRLQQSPIPQFKEDGSPCISRSRGGWNVSFCPCPNRRMRVRRRLAYSAAFLFLTLKVSALHVPLQC